MVITEALWRSAFNADPGVVGRTVGEAGHEVRLIGVLPAHARIGGRELGPMTAGKPTEFFFPFEFGPDFGGSLTSVWSNFNYTVIARLKPGVTPAQALAQLNVIQAHLAADAPHEGPGELLAQVTPVLDYATESARQGLWLLLGAVGAVLLIISVNLGGLWVSRVVDRRRDWAIRLGARGEARPAGTAGPGRGSDPRPDRWRARRRGRGGRAAGAARARARRHTPSGPGPRGLAGAGRGSRALGGGGTAHRAGSRAAGGTRAIPTSR